MLELSKSIGRAVCILLAALLAATSFVSCGGGGGAVVPNNQGFLGTTTTTGTTTAGTTTGTTSGTTTAGTTTGGTTTAGTTTGTTTAGTTTGTTTGGTGTTTAGTTTGGTTTGGTTTGGTTTGGTTTGGSSIAISISPSASILVVSASHDFTATVTGTTNTQVQWTATNGVITGSGATITYTAPSSPSSFVSPVLTATSVADPTKSATLTINVIADTTSITPASLIFGNVAVGSSLSLPIAVANNAGTSITVSAVGVSGTDYSLSGPTVPFNVAAGANQNVNIAFSPQSAGSPLGNAAITVNMANGSTKTTNIALTGTGFVGIAHTVDLAWSPSTSAVAGYNAYRGTHTGGPYSTKVNATLILGTTFTDSAVIAGQTYFYVVRAVDSGGTESANSNEATAVVPTP